MSLDALYLGIPQFIVVAVLLAGVIGLVVFFGIRIWQSAKKH